MDGILQNFGSLNLLSQFYNDKLTGCLEFFTGDVSWLIYFREGEIFFADHSVLPLERLNAHLRRIGLSIVDESLLNVNSFSILNHLDYSSTYSALTQQQISRADVGKVIESVTREVLELFSWVKKGRYSFHSTSYDLPILATFDVNDLNEHCKRRLANWQKYCPLVRSPYQRPFVVAENIHSEKFLQGENSALIRRVSSLLARDLSIRHLAMRLNKDELDVAQILHSGLINKTLSLKEPSPPFNKFPTIPEPREQVFQENPEITESSSTGSGRTARKRYTIFCVDDNVSILEAISDMLPEEDFNFVSTTDPIQALMEINKITPDLILLDIEMPDLNGHKICHLFRHKRALRDVPIIMVTAKKGLVDRTVAKIKGASAYLTKPFTKKDLHTLLFQYLN